MSFTSNCIRCKKSEIFKYISSRYKLPPCTSVNYPVSANFVTSSSYCKHTHHEIFQKQYHLFRRYSSSSSPEQADIDYNTFNKVCEETLESLTEYFEELLENSTDLQTADVSYSGGVLTVHLGDVYGTYVINRQSPNKQIWLSSPTSGPKRYDLVNGDLYWIYKHDGQTLHQLLQKEISQIIKQVDFSKCAHSKL